MPEEVNPAPTGRIEVARVVPAAVRNLTRPRAQQPRDISEILGAPPVGVHTTTDKGLVVASPSPSMPEPSIHIPSAADLPADVRALTEQSEELPTDVRAVDTDSTTGLAVARTGLVTEPSGLHVVDDASNAGLRDDLGRYDTHPAGSTDSDDSKTS